jgi:hypothetical protein
MTSFVTTGGSSAGLHPVQGEGVQPVTYTEIACQLLAAPAVEHRG